MKSSWNYYGVMLIFQITVNGGPIPERLDEKYDYTHTYYEG